MFLYVAIMSVTLLEKRGVTKFVSMKKNEIRKKLKINLIANDRTSLVKVFQNYFSIFGIIYRLKNENIWSPKSLYTLSLKSFSICWQYCCQINAITCCILFCSVFWCNLYLKTTAIYERWDSKFDTTQCHEHFASGGLLRKCYWQYFFHPSFFVNYYQMTIVVVF